MATTAGHPPTPLATGEGLMRSVRPNSDLDADGRSTRFVEWYVRHPR